MCDEDVDALGLEITPDFEGIAEAGEVQEARDDQDGLVSANESADALDELIGGSVELLFVDRVHGQFLGRSAVQDRATQLINFRAGHQEGFPEIAAHCTGADG
ncbi:hypothetical protein GCM10029976_092990 [Kribbella albertanoniae]